MTVTTTVNKSTHSANGVTTSWPVAFVIPTAADVEVIVTSAAGVESTISPSSYSITGLGNAGGGTVTYPTSGSPLTAGNKLTIRRKLAIKQTTDLVTGAAFYAEDHEDVFDRNTMVDQQQQEELDRSLKIPVSDGALTVTLPVASSRANKAIVFDASGNVAVSVDDYDDQAANAAASAAAAASSAMAADASEAAALASQVAAAASAALALTSEQNADTSEAAAADSAAAALASQTAAATSEANALTYRNAAQTAATNAATSEANADTSEAAAVAAATAATTQAGIATTKAGEAAASAVAADASADAAAVSETNAASSAAAAAAATSGKLSIDGSDAMTAPLRLAMVATPAAPAAGEVKVYAKADGKLYRQGAASGEKSIGGGPSLGLDSVIRTNATTINEDIVFPAATNGMSAGPITIADGYSVTIPDGSCWSIV